MIEEWIYFLCKKYLYALKFFNCISIIQQYFQLRVKNPNKPIAPGLCVPAVVEFETIEPKEIKDRLVVTIDGDVIEIPLIA